MRVLIGADIVPTTSNQRFFENAQMEQIVCTGLLDVINSADYRIFNLEVPLTDKQEPIKKCGPNLIASTKSVAGLNQLGIDFLTLANNHIFDQGAQGLLSTTEQLDRAGIAYAGIGDTPDEAAKPYIVELGEKKIGIYCCAEHEFSIVGDKQAGANPFEPLESLDHIVELRTLCDYMICLYHGGKEHYRYPSPNLQKICRKIVDKGADLVVCQHTHCIGCEEKWQGGTIVYGQGNFLFDYSESEYWQTSVLISVDLDINSIEYIPLQKNENAVKLATDADAAVILSGLRKRTEEIKQVGFVENQYSKHARTMLEFYLMATDSISNSVLFRVINRLLNNRLRKLLCNKILNKHAPRLRNYYECEAHRELIIAGINEAGNL